MGLCLGISAVSFFEFVYYFTMWTWFTYRKNKMTDTPFRAPVPRPNKRPSNTKIKVVPLQVEYTTSKPRY